LGSLRGGKLHGSYGITTGRLEIGLQQAAGSLRTGVRRLQKAAEGCRKLMDGFRRLQKAAEGCGRLQNVSRPD